jgi:hypothetical protein
MALLYDGADKSEFLVSGLCPSSGILNTRAYDKTQRFGNWICFRPQVRRGGDTLLGPLEGVNINHWIQFPKRCVF